MKVKLVGKNLDDIRPLLPQFGMEEDGSDIELVIAHGGDGTLFIAERNYPDIPKLALRDEATAPLCRKHRLKERLADFANGKLEVTHLPKLCATLGSGESISGINDIFVHNCQRVNALRYRVFIDGGLYANEVVGDGVGISTVHGSTGYYKSITHSVFRTGIGLAFSNSTEVVDHLVLDSSSKVEIEIVRGPALVVADNSEQQLLFDSGERVTIRQSSDTAVIYGLKGFMCPECRYLRHTGKYNIFGR